MPAPRKTPTRARIGGGVRQPGVFNRLGRGADADAIAPGQAPQPKRRQARVHGVDVHLARHAAPVALGVEHRDRPDTALPGHHPAPGLFTGGAQRRHQPDAR